MAHYHYDWDRKPSRLSTLRSTLGDAVGDIRSKFLALGSADMQRLLHGYGSRYGEKAAQYALKTLPKWRSGAVRLSGQTMERLVELVPPFLSAAERIVLLEKIVEKNRKHAPHVCVRVDATTPTAGLAELDRALAGMRHTDLLAHLPPKVMDVATWLYANDITAARAVIANMESRENETVRAAAQREIDLLRRVVAAGQVKNATYCVRMPAGSLSVVVSTPALPWLKRIFG